MHERRTATVRRRDEEGASVIEYALMLALIALVCITAVEVFGNGGEGMMSRNADCVAGAMDGSIPGDCA
jgi:Flp pilus assembly pilin Flp